MGMKKWLGTALTLLILGAAVLSAAAQEVTIPSQTEKGAPLNLPGILHKPAGDGPFPAVVMLCTCAGYASGREAAHQSFWATKLVGWGYVALQVDSLTPRGYTSTCDNSPWVTSVNRSHDGYAAKAFLSKLPFVDPGAVGVIGWSDGGSGVLTIIDKFYRKKEVTPFRTAVAFYPFCQSLADPDTPLLVLTGRKDDWCPAALAESLQKDWKSWDWKPELSLTIYPNATHLFDFEPSPGAPEGGENYMGHHMDYDPEATADAVSRTRDFLANYLQPGG
jgi:dienelactone hydrolase